MGKIRPFRDDPTREVDYVWYAVDEHAEAFPYPLVFTDRFWDARERWVNPGVGTVVGSMRVYTGGLAVPPPGPILGTAEQWSQGFLYSDYVAGRLPDGRCIPVVEGCVNCPSGGTFTLYVVGGQWRGTPAAALPTLNLTVPMTYQGGCIWSSASFAVPGVAGLCHWELNNLGPLPTLGIISGGTGEIVSAGGGSAWDCRSDDLYTLANFGSLGLSQAGPVLVSSSPYGDPNLVLPGTIINFGGTLPPGGYLVCDGAAYPVTSPYDRLFAVVGHTWDTFRGQAAPPAGQFRVPLLNGMAWAASGAAVAGGGPLAPATSPRSVSDVAGVESAPMAAAEVGLHGHGLTDPGHTHGVNDPGHAHGLTDPGHFHDSQDGGHFLTTNAGSAFTANPGGNTANSSVTTTDPTGATVDAASTGLTVVPSPTGATVGNNPGGGQPLSRIQPTAFGLVCIKI